MEISLILMLIAGASIIAKVYRDDLMARLSLSKKFKKYNWGKNSAYGTESHRKTIKKHGLTPLHRKLFVRKIVGALHEVPVRGLHE